MSAHTPNLTKPAANAAGKPKTEDPDRVFLALARAERWRVRFTMRGGRAIEGAVKSFGRFTVYLEASNGAVLLFKHAIDTAEIVQAPPQGARP
jgi:RNA chaperone Hfq